MASLLPATVRLTSASVIAEVGTSEWSWLLKDLEGVFHGRDEPWTILAVPGVADHGVAVSPGDAERFRRQLGGLLPASTRVHYQPPAVVSVGRVDPGSADPPSERAWRSGAAEASVAAPLTGAATESLPQPMAQGIDGGAPVVGRASRDGASSSREFSPYDDTASQPIVPPEVPGRIGLSKHRLVRFPRLGGRLPGRSRPVSAEHSGLAGLEARRISAWFGTHRVLDSVSLEMAPGEVTALIGPSGCGKSTFLRVLNRMHELIPSAALAGEVLLDGCDIYEPTRKVTDARRQIGMVFQKPNPFPAMSIYDNVLASFTLTGMKVGADAKDEVVESCLQKAGLWNEVRDRLRQPGASLSGGQQQRLCIARALAIQPRVLLMDEPCSALDPTSTRRIEQTISELKTEVTIVIVTHNMQQAARVSDQCAFFLAEQGMPGYIVEHGATRAMFHAPQDPRTNDYVNGRFG